jgi:hypothetical protein
MQHEDLMTRVAGLAQSARTAAPALGGNSCGLSVEVCYQLALA